MAGSRGTGREGTGHEGGKGDPDIHIHSAKRKPLALSSLAEPRPLSHQICELLCEPAQRRDILQSNLLHFHLPERRRERGREVKNPIIFIKPSNQEQR